MVPQNNPGPQGPQWQSQPTPKPCFDTTAGAQPKYPNARLYRESMFGAWWAGFSQQWHTDFRIKQQVFDDQVDADIQGATRYCGPS